MIERNSYRQTRYNIDELKNAILIMGLEEFIRIEKEATEESIRNLINSNFQNDPEFEVSLQL